jgi:hypothetical protein
MRRPLIALAAAALSLAAGVALARAAAAYHSNVVGSQTAAGPEDGVVLQLNASGDLHGMLRLAIKHEGGRVTGGSWSLTVLPPNADASSSEKGRLSGSVGGGTLTTDANGVVTAAGSVQLTVQGGAGDYAGVSAGGGTVSLSADPENSTKLGGPLALDF